MINVGKVIQVSANSVVSEYEVDNANLIQFAFYTFPVSINDSIVLGEEMLGQNTYDTFVDSIIKAMRDARRQGLIRLQKGTEITDHNHAEYVYIFTVLSNDGSQAETVSRMIHVALHEWGKPSMSMPDTEKEAIRRKKIREHAPKFIDGSECIIVDSGYIADMEIGKQSEFRDQEAMIEIVSDPNVKVLRLDEAQNLLQNKLKNEWNLDLTIVWK